MGIAREIHTALNGAEAISLFNQYFDGSVSIPDIILLDLSMPIMDGFSFLEAFKKLPLSHPEKIKIIILSSSVDPKDRARAKAFGVDQYLTKPISETNLAFALQDT